MFKQQHPEGLYLEAVASRLGAVSDAIQSAGVLNHRPDPKWQEFELAAFRQQVMGYVAAGAPFRHLELVYRESSTRLLIVVNFDIFNRATFGEIRAEKTSYNHTSDVDFEALNNALAIAAGIPAE